jgi:hypothetical protein
MVNPFDIIGPINLGLFAMFTLVAAVRLYLTYMATPVGKPWLGDEKILVQVSLLALGVVEVVNGISLWVEHGYVC